MRWLTERFQTAKEALGIRRFLIGSIVTAFVGLGDQLANAILHTSLAAFFGIPRPIIWIGVGLLLLLHRLLEYSNNLRDDLRPKLTLSFVEDGGGKVQTPEKLRNEQGQVIKEWQAIYLRIKAESTSSKKVRECSAFLIGIERKHCADKLTSYKLTDPIQLAWSNIGIREVDIPHSIPRYVDVLKTTNERNKLEFTGPWPLTLRGIFDEQITYVLTIAVVGEDITTSTKLEVDWTGQWDTISVRQV